MTVPTEGHAVKDTVVTDPATTGQDGRDKRSIAELVKHASGQVSILVKEEIKLAKLELSHKSKRASKGAGLLGAALLIALYALGVLITAAVLGVAEVFQPWLAALIIGGGLLVLAVLFALIGKRQLKAAKPLAPSETIESVRDDIGALKGKN